MLLVYVVENNKIAFQKQAHRTMHVIMNLKNESLQTAHNGHIDCCEFTHTHVPTPYKYMYI